MELIWAVFIDARNVPTMIEMTRVWPASVVVFVAAFLAGVRWGPWIWKNRRSNKVKLVCSLGFFLMLGLLGVVLIFRP